MLIMPKSHSGRKGENEVFHLAHLRFSPMRFEIGNNHDNFQEQHYPADAP